MFVLLLKVCVSTTSPKPSYYNTVIVVVVDCCVASGNQSLVTSMIQERQHLNNYAKT